MTNQKNSISGYYTKRIDIALYGLLLSGTVIDLINVVTKLLIGQSFGTVETVVNIIGILMFLYGSLELMRKDFLFVIKSLMLFLLLWVGSGLLFSDNVQYLKENAGQFFIYVLPFCWFGHYVIRSGMYLNSFLKICRVKLFFALISQIIILLYPSADIFGGDYMDAANAMLVGIIGTYYLTARDKRKFDMLLSVLSTFVILICGSRGVFLSLCFFWILYLVYGQIKKKALYITLLAALGVLVSLFVNPILLAIEKVASNLGFSVHLISALINNNMFEDSNRIKLIEFFWNAIFRKPFGYGVMGDRYISYKTGFYYKPIYPHNIMLEVAINFGIFIGLFLVLWFLMKCIKCFYQKSDVELKATVMVLLSCCIVRLMFSSSYWNDQMFFMLIGVFCAISRKRYRIRF